jgi:hypothetical protein
VCFDCRLDLEFVMMDQSIITCDDAAHRVPTFEVIMIQVTAADGHMTAPTVWVPIQYKLHGTQQISL